LQITIKEKKNILSNGNRNENTDFDFTIKSALQTKIPKGLSTPMKTVDTTVYINGRFHCN
jgi:hypothetical protein